MSELVYLSVCITVLSLAITVLSLAWVATYNKLTALEKRVEELEQR